MKKRKDKISKSYAKKIVCKNKKEMNKNLNKKIKDMINIYDF